jgi:hypothetical protein
VALGGGGVSDEIDEDVFVALDPDTMSVLGEIKRDELAASAARYVEAFRCGLHNAIFPRQEFQGRLCVWMLKSEYVVCL